MHSTLLVVIISHLTSVSDIIVKNNQEILVDLADFADFADFADLFLGHGIMVHVPWPLSQSNPWNCAI